jgi:hypothetical protein
MIQFAFLGKSKSQDPEFQKEYLKVVGEEPTPAVPDQMEKLVRELPRATEIVALSERVSEKCMIARPAPQIARLCSKTPVTLLHCQNNFSRVTKGNFQGVGG